MDTRFNGLKTEIDTHEIKIDKLSKDSECNSPLKQNFLKAVTDDMSTFTFKLDSLKNQVVLLGATHTPNTSSSTPVQQPSNIGSIAKEIAARASRRNNILITGLPHDNVTAGEDRIHSIVINNLHLSNDINTIPLITCKRVGKLSTKPQPLLVAFNDAHYRDRALSKVKLLRLSASASIKDSAYIFHSTSPN